jgi:hypothetical protein
VLRFFVPSWLLAALAGCAAPVPAAAPQAAAAPPAHAAPTLLQGVVVAIRPVPAAAMFPVRLGWPGAERHRSVTEFILHLEDGSTLAVVQPDPVQLHVGQRVGILPGALPRLVAVPQSTLPL